MLGEKNEKTIRSKLQLNLYFLNNLEIEFGKKIELISSFNENLKILMHKNEILKEKKFNEEKEGILSNLSDDNLELLEVSRLITDIEKKISDEKSNKNKIKEEIEKLLESSLSVLDQLDEFSLFVEKHSFLSFIMNFIDNFKDSQSIKTNIINMYKDNYSRLKELLSK